MDEIYTLNYTKTHTFRTIGIVLLFQKLFSRYYYASGFSSGDKFCVNPFEDSAYYDLLSLSLLGTENMDFYSDGIDKTRFEKTEFLTHFNEVKNSISVCWRQFDNCSECPKCIRTMAALELIGKLDEYCQAFDLEKYKKNYVWNWAKILSLKDTDYFYEEIAREAYRQNIRFSGRILALSVCFKIGRFVANPKLLSFFQRALHRS